MSTLNKQIIVEWILAYACEHHDGELIHTIITDMDSKWLNNNKQCDQQMEKIFSFNEYAFISHIIINTHKGALVNENMWKTCVNYLESIYAKNNSIPFSLFMRLYIKFKLITILISVNNDVHPDDIKLLMNEYFPDNSLETRRDLKFRFRIKSLISDEMHAIVNKYTSCRNMIVKILFKFHDSEDYREFLLRRLKIMSTTIQSDIEKVFLIFGQSSGSVLENILTNTSDELDTRYGNEVTMMKQYLGTIDDGKKSTSQKLITILKALLHDDYKHLNGE